MPSMVLGRAGRKEREGEDDDEDGGGVEAEEGGEGEERRWDVGLVGGDEGFAEVREGAGEVELRRRIEEGRVRLSEPAEGKDVVKGRRFVPGVWS